ncbi:MAG: hypothetical protein HC893_00920 [Chloroflexaceae bacterium]|nr:hypothetical protein [Chloroflexaceae bacterium]
MECGSTTTVSYNGADNWYTIDCTGDDPDTTGVVEGGQNGQTITFEVDGVQTDQTEVWTEGGYRELNLTASASPPSSENRLFLDPSDMTGAEGQILIQQVKVFTNQPVDTIGVHVTINTPGPVTLVDASGNPATSIEANPLFAGDVTFNRVDNTTGQIDFSITRLDNPLPAGEYPVATIRYQVSTGATVGDSTTISFIRSGARYSDMVYEGSPLNATLEDGSITVGDGIVLNGIVEPTKYRGSAGDPRWITNLFWNCVGPGTEPWASGIVLRNAGAPNSEVLATFPVTTDANGHFTVLLTGIVPGVYDITVKGDNTLSARMDDVTLPAATPVDFGLLRVGDSDGSNVIDHVDLSYVIAAFLSSQGDLDYRSCSDNNRDGYVNVIDASLINRHYLQIGLAAMEFMDTFDLVGNVEGASLTVSEMSSSHIRAGDVVTAEVVADTGTGSIDSVGGHLNFDPSLVVVVGVDGKPVSSLDLSTDVFEEGMVYSTVDNEAGSIDIAATRLGMPFQGRTTLTRIHLKARQDLDTSSINLTFVRDGTRHSDLLLAGQSLEPEIDPAPAPHGHAHQVYLPIMLR